MSVTLNLIHIIMLITTLYLNVDSTTMTGFVDDKSSNTELSLCLQEELAALPQTVLDTKRKTSAWNWTERNKRETQEILSLHL